MSQQRAGPPAPLLPAAKRDECRIGIGHTFHRNGLTGRENTQPRPVLHALKITLYLCKACFEPIDKLFGQEQLVKASGLDRRMLIWGRSLRKLISSPSLGTPNEETFRILEQATG